MKSNQDKITITPCSNGWIVRVKVTDYYDEFVFTDWKLMMAFLAKPLIISVNQEV